MFIQTEPTEDANTLRFLPGRRVLEGEGLSFAAPDAAARSPLAARLFEVEGVSAVSLGSEHVAVTKAEAADWQLLKPMVLGILMEHFLAGRPALAAATAAEAPDFEPEDAEVVAELKELLDARIRPALLREGGDLAVRRFRDGVVELELRGAAFSMPRFTLEVRIENTLRHYVPEVEAVHFVAPEAPGADLDLDDPEVVAVYELLEGRVNPAVAAHGGHIALLDVKDHTAYIRLEGGCQGCGMADVTLKQGVETMIKEAVPTIAEVLDTTDHAAGTNPYYQPGKGGASPL